MSAFRRPFDLDGYEVFTTASIGITVYPEDGPDAETLVKNADAAMYSAKDSGRSGYHFYTRAIYDQAMTAMRMESRLRSARENGEFSLVYQPVVGAEDGRVRTVETLLRWNNAEFGNVPPDQFIPLAEERGLITDIGAWVLDTACREFASWTSGLGRARAPGREHVKPTASPAQHRRFGFATPWSGAAYRHNAWNSKSPNAWSWKTSRKRSPPSTP